MPKQKPFEAIIPALYKKNALDLMMFGYVRGYTTKEPVSTMVSGVRQFLKEFGFGEDDFPMECALKIYKRMLRDYLTLNKTL